MQSAAAWLRLHAGSIGLDSTFTVLDRTDSADLLDLVRNEHGLSRTASRSLSATARDDIVARIGFITGDGNPLDTWGSGTFVANLLAGAELIRRQPRPPTSSARHGLSAWSERDSNRWSLREKDGDFRDHLIDHQRLLLHRE
jgi:hypothetical protein